MATYTTDAIAEKELWLVKAIESCSGFGFFDEDRFNKFNDRLIRLVDIRTSLIEEGREFELWDDCDDLELKLLLEKIHE